MSPRRPLSIFQRLLPSSTGFGEIGSRSNLVRAIEYEPMETWASPTHPLVSGGETEPVGGAVQ